MTSMVTLLTAIAMSAAVVAQAQKPTPTPTPTPKPVDISGKWVVALELSIGTSAPALEIKQDGTAVSPQAIAFDQIRVDERSERRTVRLENCGELPTTVRLLGVTASRGSADSWQLLPPQLMQTLEPGEKLAIEVFFAPARTGPHLASIELLVDGLRQDIELTGEAIGDNLDRKSLYGCDCNTGGTPPLLLVLFVLVAICRRRSGSS